MTTLAITGVTGHSGGFVAKELSEAGVSARHLARSPERAPKLAGATVKKCRYEYSDEVIAALSGIDVLFMISAKENPERLRQHRLLLMLLKWLVLSILFTLRFTMLVQVQPLLWRVTMRQWSNILRKKDWHTLFFRDNFYIDFFVDMARQYGEIKDPAGNGKVSAVVRSDVTDVAVEILKNPKKWVNQTLNMTGPEELTLSEMAEQISHSLGKMVTYVEETVEEAYDSRKNWQAEQWEYDSWVSTYTAIAKGEQAGLSDDIECVLGKAPTSLAEYLRDLS